MKDVAKLLNAMQRDGVVVSYAVFGAVAQMRYTEAVSTLDADILVAVEEQDPLTVLSSIYQYCRALGYEPEGEAIRVGEWPVQFIPFYDELTSEALQSAEEGEIDGEPLKVVKADYLAAIALKTGRNKDYLRLNALLEAGAVKPEDLMVLVEKHGLIDKWEAFQKRFL
jgi:hypothetical protein